MCERSALNGLLTGKKISAVEVGRSALTGVRPRLAAADPGLERRRLAAIRQRMRRNLGGRLAFHGCISTAGPVASGTVGQTVACVRDTLAVMMPGGGYCFAPTHQLQDNSPTENVVAMYETAHEYGRYT